MLPRLKDSDHRGRTATTVGGRRPPLKDGDHREGGPPLPKETGDIQGERHLKLSFHASAAMPTHNDTYRTCPTRVSALKAGKRHVPCGRHVLFLLLPLEDGRAAGVRGRRFTSKAGQRAAHVAASLEMWPRLRRAFRSLFAWSTRSAYGGCFARRRNLLYLVKSPQHSTGSLATVLRERECRALACTKATRP